MDYLPEVCPTEIQKAHFQAVLPRDPPEGPKPLVLQFAGTGDHFFWYDVLSGCSAYTYYI